MSRPDWVKPFLILPASNQREVIHFRHAGAGPERTSVSIEPMDPAGEEEHPTIRLDPESMAKLRHWLNTGENVPRGEAVPVDIGAVDSAVESLLHHLDNLFVNMPLNDPEGNSTGLWPTPMRQSVEYLRRVSIFLRHAREEQP